MPRTSHRLPRRFWVGLAIVVVNAVLLTCIISVAFVVTQHERVLDQDTTEACLLEATDDVVVTHQVSDVRFSGENTIVFTATPPSGSPVEVRCTVAAHGDTVSDELTVVQSEVIR